jgi:hypothetical protein
MRKQSIQINHNNHLTGGLSASFAKSKEVNKVNAKSKWSVKVKILIAVLSVAVAAAVYGYYLFNKPVENMINLATDFKISAQQLQAAYENDEKNSDKKYLGKVIEVSGIIQSVDKDPKGNVSVLLETDNPISAVSCSFDTKTNNEISKLKFGDKVTFKGFCSGYLSDVVMVRCIQVK